ncbi:MAG: DMT family transporter [Proteobacteria bacterium]|nr:DMT family transporter [Pseudomonadota bacterium]
MAGIEKWRLAFAAPGAASAGGDEKPVATTITAPRQDVLGGIFWGVLAMALFAGLAASSRHAMSLGYHPLEIAFFRFLSALILMLPLLFWRGLELVRSSAPELYAVRALISLFSMTSWFYAISLIPLGELTAIGFLSPLFGTLGAIFILGEKVRLRRWTALGIGFIGAMIILRPGHANFGLGEGLALLSTLTGGVMSILLKQLASRDDPDKIVFLTTLIMTPIALIPALFVWRWPTSELFWPMVIVGLTGVLGHMSLARAFRAAEASLVVSLEFARLPFTVVLAYFMFNELIDIWTWVGAAIIFSSAVYINRREAQLRREARAKEMAS